jgi:hypothetical protein
VSDFSIDMLAGALKVSRRTIERCIADGSLVPVPGVVATGGSTKRQRYTFNAARVAELTARAETARELGLKNIMDAVLAAGPVTRKPRYTPAPRLSPTAFIARVLWKRQYLPRCRKSATITRNV